jgi:hypothetical protein
VRSTSAAEAAVVPPFRKERGKGGALRICDGFGSRRSLRRSHPSAKNALEWGTLGSHRARNPGPKLLRLAVGELSTPTFVWWALDSLIGGFGDGGASLTDILSEAC